MCFLYKHITLILKLMEVTPKEVNSSDSELFTFCDTSHDCGVAKF
jgi:hypothetical protein